MALLSAAVARRASALLRPAAAAASIRRMSSTSSANNIRALRGEAATLRAKATVYRVKADALRATSHDSEVIRVIQSAIQPHEHSLVGEIPSNFPFKINKRDGLTDITLTRRLKGEQIEVLVSMPTLDQDEDEDSSSSDGYTSYSDDEDEGEKSPQKHTVPLTVTVSKADGSSLEFTCTAYPDRVVINAISMKSGGEEEEDATASEDEEDDLIAPDEVVEFSELDANVQHTLYRYLEVRGITAANTNILCEHMISKDRRRYLLWLAKLLDFVKKD